MIFHSLIAMSTSCSSAVMIGWWCIDSLWSPGLVERARFREECDLVIVFRFFAIASGDTGKKSNPVCSPAQGGTVNRRVDVGECLRELLRGRSGSIVRRIRR